MDGVAYQLVKALRDEIKIPVHLHTHDTTGAGVATVLKAAEAGVDIADLAIESMSSCTSQPSLNVVVEALKGTEREMVTIQGNTVYFSYGGVRPAVWIKFPGSD